MFEDINAMARLTILLMLISFMRVFVSSEKPNYIDNSSIISLFHNITYHLNNPAANNNLFPRFGHILLYSKRLTISDEDDYFLENHVQIIGGNIFQLVTNIDIVINIILC